MAVLTHTANRRSEKLRVRNSAAEPSSAHPIGAVRGYRTRIPKLTGTRLATSAERHCGRRTGGLTQPSKRCRFRTPVERMLSMGLDVCFHLFG